MAHKPGTFCWTDLAAPDMAGAEFFYTRLFGWTSEPAGDPEQTGDYTFFKLRGKRVAGYGPPGPGERPSWRPYVAVESADDVAAAVRDAGGELLLEPMDVLEEGRMAVFRDPPGAVCCVWQPRAHKGAEAIGERGALGWLEHATRDRDAARRFYGAVFGWTAQDVDDGYAIWTLDGVQVGGLRGMELDPSEVPPYWLVNFVVEDVDAACDRVSSLAGNASAPPTTVEIPGRGDLRFAMLGDSNGAVFGVFAG